VTRVTFVDPTTETFWIHANLVDVLGVGTTSGLTYHAVGSVIRRVDPEDVRPRIVDDGRGACSRQPPLCERHRSPDR
jgi:hypothetical protein